jgi:RNA polymerase sigma factor FliA
MEAAVRAYQNTTQKDLRDRLVLENLDYVRHLLGRMRITLPAFIDEDNLEAAGVLGLVEAAQQFDPRRGVEFKTFAYHRIRGAILDELRRNCPVPQHVLERWAEIRRVWERLGEHVTPADLARECDLTEEEVEGCLEAIRLTQPATWDEELANIARSGHGDEQPERALDEADQLRLLANAIEQLPERLRIVLSLYHLENLRLKEIGEVLELSESRVSRLLTQAEMRLRGILSRELSET